MFILCLKDCTPWPDSGNEVTFKAGTVFAVKSVNDGIAKVRQWPEDATFFGRVANHVLGSIDYADMPEIHQYIFRPEHGRQTYVAQHHRLVPWLLLMQRMLSKTVMHGITVTQVTHEHSKQRCSLHALDEFTIRNITRLPRGSKPEFEAVLWSNEQAYTIRFDHPKEILGDQ
jgi:hypothetical protein